MAKTEVTGSQIRDKSVSLADDVTGVLPVANGGSGSDALALNNVLLGNGTGAVQTVAPGASGNILTSDGTTWVSSAPATGAGTGDVSSSASTSVDSEVVVYSGTSGKAVKRATGSGIAVLASGVLATVSAPTGTVVGTTDSQTLTNKVINGPDNTLTNISQLSVSNLTTDLSGKEPAITVGTTGQYWRGDKSWQTLDKSAVGLGSVDNTSDSTKNAAAVTLTNKTISGSNNTLSDIPQSSVTGLTTDLAAKEDTANKGQSNGYASLDSGGKIPVSQLPNSVMEYQGVFNASTNSPSLSDGTGNAGDVYRVSVAGTRNFGSGSITLRVGDYVIYSGSVWQKSATTDNVASVASLTGDVSSSSLKSALALDNVDNTSDATKNSASVTLTNKTLTNPTINGYTEGILALGTVGSSATISIAEDSVVTATLTASTACTFTMPAVGAGKSFTVFLKQAATTGNGTATFSGVKWGVTGTPTMTAAAGKMDVFTFFSDGTNWYGSAAQGYTP